MGHINTNQEQSKWYQLNKRKFSMAAEAEAASASTTASATATAAYIRQKWESCDVVYCLDNHFRIVLEQHDICAWID